MQVDEEGVLSLTTEESTEEMSLAEGETDGSMSDDDSASGAAVDSSDAESDVAADDDIVDYSELLEAVGLLVSAQEEETLETVVIKSQAVPLSVDVSLYDGQVYEYNGGYLLFADSADLMLRNGYLVNVGSSNVYAVWVDAAGTVPVNPLDVQLYCFLALNSNRFASGLDTYGAYSYLITYSWGANGQLVATEIGGNVQAVPYERGITSENYPGVVCGLLLFLTLLGAALMFKFRR